MIFNGNRSFRAFFSSLSRGKRRDESVVYDTRSLVHTHAFTLTSEREKGKERESANFYYQSFIDLEDE